MRTPSPPAPTPSPTAATPTPARGTALALLRTLVVKGRAPRTGYARSQFGQAWADTDRNGCDNRSDVLRRDLTRLTLRGRCVVLRGHLHDPYTARGVDYERGGPSEVDVDHVVSLSDAWQKGAQQWPHRKRLAFGNDPLNLLAVSSGANRAKSDSDAASWLPPARGYWCAMVARQVAVKARYALWVTTAERDAMARVLATCPTFAAPVSVTPTEAPFDAPRQTSPSPR